ncbi:MAG: cisplatin damage response ATP-dependent DNA ligase [Rhodospirillales bacterium]|nr:cisplatin damage response ATP-dependent DNA ligase [Rhodospirillales bacterium]
MIRFASLLEGLLFARGRTTVLALLRNYFETTPDPDRGFALAALAGRLDLPVVGAGLLRTLASARTDPELFATSYQYVGDLGETLALMWPAEGSGEAPRLSEIVSGLRDTAKADRPSRIAAWLDASPPAARLALLKLVTGGLRPGDMAGPARRALADMSRGHVTETQIEEIWPALSPPYEALFAWIERRATRPDTGGHAHFRPPMLANPLEDAELAALELADYVAEWKWDGLRVQLVGGADPRVLSGNGDDISASFPDLAGALNHGAVLDGELLVTRDGGVAPFADLQRRLGRRAPGRAVLERFPAHVRLFDILCDEGEDLRELPFASRRARLEAWFARVRPARADLSPLLAVSGPDQLRRLCAGTRAGGVEGLMLKRADSPYRAGRPPGLWWEYRGGPFNIDAVLMYAERGPGERGSFYSNVTFGVWDGEVLVPVGKAEPAEGVPIGIDLDGWVRQHTAARFGPVRDVVKSLVLDVAFDGVRRSPRHRSGITLRCPRIVRLRPDKLAAEAGRLAHLTNFLAGDDP